MTTGGARSPACGWRSLSPAALVLVLLASCQGTAEEQKAVPASPPVVAVTMTEYAFQFNSNILPGRVVFQVSNDGREPHLMNLVPLPEDLPPLDDQLRGSERRILPPFARVTTLQPGQSGTFAVDLEAGVRYGLICNLVDASNEVHAELGMNAEFRAADLPLQSDSPPLSSVAGSSGAGS